MSKAPDEIYVDRAQLKADVLFNGNFEELFKIQKEKHHHDRKYQEIQAENERLEQEVERLEQANKELDYAYYMLYERSAGHNYGLYCELERVRKQNQILKEGLEFYDDDTMLYHNPGKAKQKLAEAEQVGEVQNIVKDSIT